MCGIFCSISRHNHVPPSDSVKHLLQSRGPDASNQISIRCQADGRTTSYLTCYSTVLSLRGSVTTEQPFQGPSSDDTLCWNGEAWAVSGERPKGNDTAAMFDLLKQAASQPIPPMDAREEGLLSTINFARALSGVAGPYSIVFYDAKNSRVYFGRDFLGRRSLLWRVTSQGDLMISSITDGASGDGWTEVEADGVYSIDLSNRSYGRDQTSDDLSKWGEFSVSHATYCCIGDDLADNRSVIPRLLLNREAASSSSSPITDQSSSVVALEALLRNSLSARVLDIPELPAVATTSSRRAKRAILFSGGLDCTVLARISHDSIPVEEPIDLLNVAFQNPRVHKSTGEASYELCPDRITARAAFSELCRVCPGRDWRLIAIDVPYSEFQEHRQQVITLMHPHNTEMDLSIACALYFAARGIGNVRDDSQNRSQHYESSARVLLSGLGADELFAGYTRHATAFKRSGLAGLLDELDLDVGRLGKRNLGRDDRAISHWGREARFPFLDENLVRWALALPVMEKCEFGVDPSPFEQSEYSCGSIEPGKKVLRCLAWKLGMKAVAREKKRAIQFGARTAKMETGKTKGTTLLS